MPKGQTTWQHPPDSHTQLTGSPLLGAGRGGWSRATIVNPYQRMLSRTHDLPRKVVSFLPQVGSEHFQPRLSGGTVWHGDACSANACVHAIASFGERP